MECIRRYYAGDESPLTDVIDRDRAFYDLFVDFKGFVDFFLLQDCVSEDYQKVSIWEGKGDFSEDGLPQTVERYMTFVEKEYDFLAKRNQRIQEYCRKKKM